MPAPSITTWRGDNQETGGPCSCKTRAPAIQVNKTFIRGCFDLRHHLLPPKSGEEPESLSVLHLAPSGTMVGSGGHALSTSRGPFRPPRRVPPTSGRFYPSGTSLASSHRLSTQLISRRSPTFFFMASLLCCGPKLAACGIVLSSWGVIMLVRGPAGENQSGPDGPRYWKAPRLGDPRP